MNALLISDLHLDDSTVDAFAALEKTLAAARQMRDDVYILGDLVEVWIGDDDDSALATRVRTLLRSYSDDIRIRFMHGNRDFLIGEQFAQDTQIEILPDPYELEIDGLNVLLSHGDSLCTDDTKYQQMRNLFRSSEWQHNILKQTLEDRRVFAQSLRDQSRRENSNKAQYIMDVNDTATIELVRKYQADILIHGHTHRPGKHSLHNGKIRYVLGDWFSVGWLARISNRSITLECFRI